MTSQEPSEIHTGDCLGSDVAANNKMAEMNTSWPRFLRLLSSSMHQWTVGNFI